MRLTGVERYRFARDCVQAGGRNWRKARRILSEQGVYCHEDLLTEGRIKAAIRDYEKLAAQYGRNHVSFDEAIQYPRENGGRTGDNDYVRTYTYTGLMHDELVRIPVFDGEPHLTGDWVICGDVHLPTTDYTLAEQMLNMARTLELKRLLIVGDLLNFDAFSAYEHLVPPLPLEAEVQVAVRFMAQLAERFDEILLVLGNHEHRLLKRTNGNISATMLNHILNASAGKLRVSPYAYAVIESGGQTWRATHQRNYSRITGRVADQLAQKYQCNIISFHQHHVGVLRDTWNNYTIIDGGGLHDDTKMAYVKLVDSTLPSMARGFVLLVNGVGHLVTPYASMTDSNALLTGLKKKRA